MPELLMGSTSGTKFTISMDILLHTADSALDFGYENSLDYHQVVANFGRQQKQQNYDQIIPNLRSIYKERDENEDYKNDDDNNDFTNANEKQEVDQLLTEVTSSIDKIKDYLVKLKKYGVLTVDLLNAHKRHKRDVSKLTVNATEVNVINNVTNNDTTTKAPPTATLKVEALRVNENKTELLAKNVTSDNRRKLDVLLVAPPPPLSNFVPTTLKVKDKLLSYIADTFKEVENKIEPLTALKIALSNYNIYKVGYIIATIDTLEVHMKKLKAEVYLHQHDWDENGIFDLFDRIKTTNNVISSLLESLQRYLLNM